MCSISCFIFKVNQIFIEHNPSKKVVIDGEEPCGIDIDTIVNLEDLPRPVLVNEECGGLKVVVWRAWWRACDICYKRECFQNKYVE